MEPTASMLYDGIKLATIHQSSAAKEALLLHRATKRRMTATVARTPHATVTWATRSRPGLIASMRVSIIKSILAGTLIESCVEKLCIEERDKRGKSPDHGGAKGVQPVEDISLIISLPGVEHTAVRDPTCQIDG